MGKVYKGGTQGIQVIYCHYFLVMTIKDLLNLSGSSEKLLLYSFINPPKWKCLKYFMRKTLISSSIKKTQFLFNHKGWNFLDKVLYKKLIAILDPTVTRH